MPGIARQTAAKLTVPLTIKVDGRTMDVLKLTDAASNRKAVVAAIMRHAGNERREDADALVAAILVEAQQRLTSKSDGGPTV
ncbi:MAG: hypothetical protein RIC55_09435 [Pirellulaceae bacterium]